MCGILYSLDKHNINDLDALKRRGPDGFKESENELGYFAHSLLNSIGESMAQPYHTKKGILLYNGSTYNSKDQNDTEWIGDQLDDNLDHTVSLIRSLRGEYALIYVTENHIVFCTDEFYMRNLWWYYSQSGKQITISSIEKTVKNKHGGAWYCAENIIYVLDRKTFKMRTLQNRFWNFDQTVNNYDMVYEKFEQAIKNRYNPTISTAFQSSGIDSGAINCAIHKFFDRHNAIMDLATENKDIIKKRLEKHNFAVIQYDGEQIEKSQIFNELYSAGEVFLHAESDPLINLMKVTYKKFKSKVIIAGNGGNEIYQDKSREKDSTWKARTNGLFPDVLSLIWPWHNQPNDRMYTGNSRFDYIGGWFGMELRYPFLDQDLVQTWLNTTQKLKNTHPRWQVHYMKEHDYPHDLNKYSFNVVKSEHSWLK